MIMTQKEAAHRLRMATIGKTGYENTLVSVDALRIVLDSLDAHRGVERIAQPECKHCDDTGSLSKSLEGQYDCHHCGRAEENVRVLKWYADTHLDSGSEADVLNVYYHGVAAGADLQRARIAELEREVAANRVKIAAASVPAGWKLVPIEPTPDMCRALFRNLIHADEESRVIKAVMAAAPSPADNGGGNGNE